MSIARFESRLLSASIRTKMGCSVRFIALPTIRCLVYSRVVFQVLVLQIIGINSVRGGLASRYAVSLSSTPDIIASQQRWCDESYSPRICVAYQTYQGTGRNTASAK